jgi:predicted dienelactone hydrolase
MSTPLRMLALLALLPASHGRAMAAESLSLQRQDGATVPAMAYAPARAACRGIAVISHGAGGSAEGYSYLGETMSGLGYLTVAVGHEESGRGALREHMRGNGLRDGLGDLITDPAAYRGRFMDIAAATQWAQARCRSRESILLGHSMGAATAMIEAGARNTMGVAGTDAFSAYVALSPQGAGPIFPAGAWSDIRKPVLLLTGTRDTELGGASWETRTEPFREMPAGCKWLGVIDGATHMNFAGRGASRQAESLVGRTIGAFLQGLRRGDCRYDAKLRGIDVETR